MLRAGFGQNQRTVLEVERCQVLTSPELCSFRAPMQTPGDHEVQHEPKIAFDSNRNSFPDPPNFADRPPFYICQRWLRCTEQERARQAYVLNRLAQYAGFESIDVSGDIWQFRHDAKASVKL